MFSVEYYSAIKRNGPLITYNNREESQEHYVKWKKADTKEYILCNSTDEIPDKENLIHGDKKPQLCIQQGLCWIPGSPFGNLDS